MLLLALAWNCEVDFPASGVLINECYVCNNDMPPRVIVKNAAIMCDELKTELLVFGDFVLIGSDNETILEMSGNIGVAHIWQHYDQVEINGASLEYIRGKDLIFKAYNSIRYIFCVTATLEYSSSVLDQLECKNITIWNLSVLTAITAKVGTIVVVADAAFYTNNIVAEKIEINGEFSAISVSVSVCLVNMFATFEFGEFNGGVYEQHSYSSGNGELMRVDNVELSNAAMAQLEVLTVTNITILQELQLLNNCQISAEIISLHNKIICRGIINTTSLELEVADFNSDKCTIYVNKIQIIDSHVEILQPLLLSELSILTSSFEFANITTDSANVIDSQLNGENLNSTTYFAQTGGSLEITNKIWLVSAYIQPILQAGMLLLQPEREFTTVHLGGVLLFQADGNLTEYAQLLEAIDKVVLDSLEYNELVDALSEYHGTLVVSTTTLLDCQAVDASVLVCNGEIKLSAHQSLTTKYAAIFNTKLQNELYELTFLQPTASGIRSGCLRSRIPVQMHILRVLNQFLTINEGTSSMASFEVSDWVVVANSRISGYFSFISVQIEIFDISLVVGDLEIKSESIMQRRGSEVTMSHVNFTSKNQIFLDGDVLITGMLSTERSVVFNAPTVHIYNLTAFGQMGRRREGECCGGSSAQLGGCSLGSPLPPGSSNAGDTCEGNLAGQEPGAKVLISATNTEIFHLELNGKISVYNTYNQCSGAGSGGELQLKTFNLHLQPESSIQLDGGDCQEFCLTGGAGSSGILVLSYVNLFLNDLMLVSDLDWLISRKNGICEFESKDPQDLCGFLTYLDYKTMNCEMNYGMVVFMGLCVLAVACLAVWLIIHCQKSRYYDDREEARRIMTDEELYEGISLNYSHIE